MVSKVSLLFILSEFASKSDVVTWGLVWSITVFTVLFLGFDLFHNSNRDLVSSSKKLRLQVVQKQWTSYFLIYIITLPIILVGLTLVFDSYNFAIHIALIIFLEHQAQEIYRILIVLNKQVKASILLFIRYGFWVWLILIYALSIDRVLNIKDVLNFWAMSLVLVYLLSLLFINEFIDIKLAFKNLRLKNSTIYIKSHFINSWKYFLSTLIVLFIITGDKFILNEFSEISSAYVYVFSFSIIYGLQNFIDPALFSFYYPKLIKNFKEKDFYSFVNNSNKLYVLTSIFSLLLSIFSIIFINLYKNYISTTPEIFDQYKSILILIACSSFFYSISLTSHFILYAGDQKSHIYNSSLFSFLIILILLCILFFSSVQVSYIISICLLFFMIFLMIFKSIYAINFLRSIKKYLHYEF